MNSYDVIIIGGGVIGAAVARELSRFTIRTALIEKEADVAEGTSKANSGVLHAGFNVRPGSLKAEFNLEGLKAFPSLADELGVEWSRCEKLVTAIEKEEFPYLEKLLAQGKANGCSGLSIIGGDEIRRLEPEVRGERALYSRSTGIVTPFQYNIALAENAADNGVDFFLSTEVTGIERAGEHFSLTAVRTPTVSGGPSREGMGEIHFSAGIIVNAAGLYSDRIAALAGAEVPRIRPCRGEYFITDRKAGRGGGKRPFLKRAVYPVPPADGSGLGVHLTPTVNGNILIGPSAEYIPEPGALENTKETMALLKAEAAALLPGLEAYDLIKSYSGNRAKLFGPGDGVSFADFHIAEAAEVPGLINLVGIESPGLTASPAVARHVREMIGGKVRLKQKTSFHPRWRGAVRLERMNPEARAALAEEKPDYGEIVCRCEGVSRGEILMALENPLGVKTLNGVKKRTHAMMGRCQSGFCLPRILSILMEEGLEPRGLVKDGPGGEILAGWREEVGGTGEGLQ